MANYTAANLTKYQARILGKFQAGELRFRAPEVFMSLKKDSELLIPSHKEIKNAAKRTTGEVNFFGRSARSLGNGGEVHNHAGAKGDSNVIVPSWTPYDDKFYHSLKQANGSVFALEEMIMNELTNLNINFTEGLESAAVAWVHANRSGVNVGTVEGSFNATNDAFEITEAFSNSLDRGFRAIQIAKSNLSINKWKGGSYVAYCDTISFNKFQMLANQGSGNNVNSSFQFSGVMFIHAPGLDAVASGLSYTKGYWIMVQEGNTAVLDWMPVQNRAGATGPDNTYGSIIHPVTGLALATHQYAARADESSNGGDKQDVKTEVQAFTYLSINHSPLTTADETPLLAYALV